MGFSSFVNFKRMISDAESRYLSKSAIRIKFWCLCADLEGFKIAWSDKQPVDFTYPRLIREIQSSSSLTALTWSTAFIYDVKVCAKLFRWHFNNLKSRSKASSNMLCDGGERELLALWNRKNNFAPLKYEIWVDNNNNKRTLSSNTHKNINSAIPRPSGLYTSQTASLLNSGQQWTKIKLTRREKLAFLFMVICAEHVIPSSSVKLWLCVE